jgi:hypothetical protein
MKQPLLLFFFCLSFLSHLMAQSDSGQRQKETTRIKTSAVESPAAPKPVRMRSLDTTGVTGNDSARIKSGSMIQPQPDSQALSKARRDTALAGAIRSRIETLGSNSLFNFTGLPVTEPMQWRRPDSKDTVFYLLVGILFTFALIRIFFEKYFSNLLTLFFRVSLRQQQIREQVQQAPLPSLLMNGLFIITGGLYAAYLLHYYRFGAALNFWLLYLNCMALLGVIYLVKFLVLKFSGWVFNISRATDTYIFVVFLVNKMLGIFLLPFLILISFSTGTAHEIYITLSVIMVFVFLAYRVLASYRPIRNEIKLTPFYFFMYLCAFEIAPLLLIYKVLLSYLEKAS